MTLNELTQAFDHEYIAEDNVRTFWNGDLKMTAELDRGMFGRDYRFRVSVDELDADGEEETNEYTWTAEELLARLNAGVWVMDGLTEAQLADLEMSARPEVELVTPATYTTKSGHVMNMFLARNICTGKWSFAQVMDKAKAMRGWYDRKSDGFMMRTEADARFLLSMMERADAYGRQSEYAKKTTAYQAF